MPIHGAHCTVVVVRLAPAVGTLRFLRVLTTEAHTRSPATRGRLRIKILANNPHAPQELHTGASPQPDDVEAARDSFFKYYKGRVAGASTWPQVMFSHRHGSTKSLEARPQHGLNMASRRPQDGLKLCFRIDRGRKRPGLNMASRRPQDGLT